MFMHIALALSFLAAVSGQDLNCGWINTLKCETFQSAPECGDDGITYDNRCTFAKAYCLDKGLHVLHYGTCLPGEASTTPYIPTVVTTPVKFGAEAVLDWLCVVVSHKDCVSDHMEICGTDGYTYPNSCEFEKERCTHRDLHPAKFGPC